MPLDIPEHHKHNPPTIRHFTPPEVKKCKEDDLTKQLQSYATTLAKLQDEYSTLQKQLQDIKEELESIRLSHVKRFGLQRFQGSDEDIRFYTGLPLHTVVFCCVCTIFLNLYSCTSAIAQENTHNPLLSRQRLLQPVDELFLVLVCLRLIYLRKTLDIDLTAALPLFYEYIQHGYRS